MCVNNLPRVALDSGEARIRTRDLLIAVQRPINRLIYHYYLRQAKEVTFLPLCVCPYVSLPAG